MAERPDESTTPSRVDRLAERFGMTKESVENLLRSTHESYSKIGTETILPPAEPPRAPIEEAAAKIPSVTPEAPKPVVPPKKGIHAGLMFALLTILLIALGLALSFQHGCFKQREEKKIVKPVDTIQSILNNAAKNASTPPQPPSNVVPNVVPPEALVVPREEPPGTSGKPSSSGITSEAQVEGATTRPFETRSNFEAEEKLAEMRANGNTRARMRAIRRHGSVVYQIYSE